MTYESRGNEVLVEDRGGKRRYWLALRELLASGRAMVLTPEAGPRSNDPVELASVVLSNLDAAARAVRVESTPSGSWDAVIGDAAYRSADNANKYQPVVATPCTTTLEQST